MTLKFDGWPSKQSGTSPKHHHLGIQTGVTVRKRLGWVVTSVTLTFDLWPWPFAWTLPWSLVITPENFMMMRWRKHSQKGVTVGRSDRRTEKTYYLGAPSGFCGIPPLIKWGRGHIINWWPQIFPPHKYIGPPVNYVGAPHNYDQDQLVTDQLVLSFTKDFMLSRAINNYTHYKVWMKLHIHSQASTVAPLKFGNGLNMSYHTYTNTHTLGCAITCTYPCWDQSMLV